MPREEPGFIIAEQGFRFGFRVWGGGPKLWKTKMTPQSGIGFATFFPKKQKRFGKQTLV